MRAKAKSSSTPYPIWVEGEYITEPPIRPSDGAVRPAGHYIDKGGYPGANVYEVDINTMCRQTDAADRFGKPIYEQDILLYETAEEIGYFIVQDLETTVDIVNGEIIEVGDLDTENIKNIGSMVDYSDFVEGIPYGNSMKLDCDMSAESTLWKAIKPDGTLVEPGTAGTLKLDQASASAGIRVNTKVEFPTSGDTYRNIAFKSLGAASGVTIPKLLIALGLYPDSGVTGYGNDQIWMRCHGERLPIRGSAFHNTSDSGPSALSLAYPRSSSGAGIGFRSAFVE